MGRSVYLSVYSLLASLVCLLHFVPTTHSQQQINYNGIIAKQTTDRFGLSLREVWDGERFLQILYSEDDEEVLACEESPAPSPPADLGYNTTFTLSPDFAWLNITSLRKDCDTAEKSHSRTRRAAKQRRTRHRGKNKPRKGRRDKLAKGKKGKWTEFLITPGTKWCGPSNVASKYTDLGIHWEADKCCRTHDRCQKFIMGMARGYNNINLNPFTLSHCSCDRRSTDLLRVPGTMWCGRGYSATSYKQLGAFSSADRCCRRHDTACPHYIPAMSYRYGLYNWRPSTLMHCHCDRRFRTCLKMAGTAASSFVGKLFFNFVQTKCFVLKTERICVQRNWWGKCQKTELRKLAHIRDNMAY